MKWNEVETNLIGSLAFVACCFCLWIFDRYRILFLYWRGTFLLSCTFRFVIIQLNYTEKNRLQRAVSCCMYQIFVYCLNVCLCIRVYKRVCSQKDGNQMCSLVKNMWEYENLKSMWLVYFSTFTTCTSQAWNCGTEGKEKEQKVPTKNLMYGKRY